MLNINKKIDGGKVGIALAGRLDTATSPTLETTLKETLTGATELEFDFSALDYISSAGLRVLLSAQKQMNRQGSMKILHVSDAIMEIFDVTGFSDILTIE